MIVDTGLLYALIDKRDKHHRSARNIFRMREARLVPEPVIVETDWLVSDRLGVEVEIQLLTGLRQLAIESPTPEDRSRAAHLVEQYRDLEIGYVDAVLVAIAERLGETTIASVDRRHFLAIRPRHVETFTLLP
ncbi:MAG: type II toxin-antitoxin system VapC family toxin [Candidatus Xenobia bacterium]